MKKFGVIKPFDKGRVPPWKTDLESWQFAVTILTLETKHHLPNLYGGNSTFINSLDKTKFSYFSFQLANTKTLEIKWSWVNRFLSMPWFPTCLFISGHFSHRGSPVRSNFPFLSNFQEVAFVSAYWINRSFRKVIFVNSLPYKVRKNKQNPSKKSISLSFQLEDA